MSRDESFGKLLFIFAKEFGWGWDYIRTIPYKIFKLYVDELVEYSKEQEAASKGHKHKRKLKPLTDEEIAARKQRIQEFVDDNKSV
jgi:hypothetical protein